MKRAQNGKNSPNFHMNNSSTANTPVSRKMYYARRMIISFLLQKRRRIGLRPAIQKAVPQFPDKADCGGNPARICFRRSLSRQAGRRDYCRKTHWYKLSAPRQERYPAADISITVQRKRSYTSKKYRIFRNIPLTMRNACGILRLSGIAWY